MKTEYGETEKDNQKEGNVKGKAWSSEETKGAKAHLRDTDVYFYYIDNSL